MLFPTRILSSLVICFLLLPEHGSKEIVRTTKYYREQHLVFFVALHEPNYTRGSNGCGRIKKQPGLMYVEAAIYMMKQINRYFNSNKTRFSYEIFDTCGNVEKVRNYAIRQGTKWLFGVGPQTEIEADLLQKVAYKGVVGFATSVEDIPDKGCQSAQFHTVPSATKETNAILSIVERFQWRYVSVVISDSRVTEVILSGLEKRLKEMDACISTLVVLGKSVTKDEYVTGVERVLDDTRSRILILITGRRDTIEIAKVLRQHNATNGKLTIVGGSLWGNLYFEDASLFDVVRGALVIAHHYIRFDGFKEYYTGLRPNATAPNNYIEFNQTWESTFNCSLAPSAPPESSCTGNETFHEGKGYYELTPLNTLTSAVSMMIGFRRSRLILRYMRGALDPTQQPLAVRFVDYFTGELHYLNESSTPINIGFDILNLQGNSTALHYAKVGEWNSTAGLLLRERDIIWGDFSPTPPTSLPPVCAVGEIEFRNESAHYQCAFRCIPCKAKEIIRNNTCVSCGIYYKPDLARNACVPLTPVSLHYKSRMGIACLSVSMVGLAATFAVVLLYIVFNKSTALRASGRELCYVILFGLTLLFSSPVVFFSAPTPFLCGIQRYIVGLSLAICYAPLFMKVYRTYRIFKHTKSLSRLSFVSPSSQIFASVLIVALQLALASIWIFRDPPLVEKHIHPNGNDVMVYCQFNSFAIAMNLLVCLVLIAPCTFMAFKTRNFPMNFNEAKSIGITMYVTCLLWAVFLPTYFFARNSSDFQQTTVLLIFCELFGFVTLIGLFVHKVYMAFHRVPVMASSRFTSETTQSSDLKKYSINGDSISMAAGGGSVSNIMTSTK